MLMMKYVGIAFEECGKRHYKGLNTILWNKLCSSYLNRSKMNGDFWKLLWIVQLKIFNWLFLMHC